MHKLLDDKTPAVRLRVALLVPLKEKEVLPVLVELLEHLNPEQLWPVEDILVRLAGDKTPSVSLGTNEATRKACRAAWQAWLDKDGKTADLAKLEEIQSVLGYTLIVQQVANRIVGGVRKPATGEVMELDTPKTRAGSLKCPPIPWTARSSRWTARIAC